jgi:3-methyladenine DNA glycosylase AlkD
VTTLTGAGDPVRAAGTSAYLRHQFPFLGITLPRLRALLRDVPMPPAEEAVAWAQACWALPEREYQYAGLAALRRVARHLPAASLPDLRGLITTKSWWDTVDALATHVVGTLVREHTSLAVEMDRWVEDEDIWVVRTAILHQERWKAGTDAGRLFAYCERRAADREFFIRKAIGWALRSYAATDPLAVQRFVLNHEAVLSGLSRREAMRGVQRALALGEAGAASRGSGRRSGPD